MRTIQKLIEENNKNKVNKWIGSRFRGIEDLTCDETGSLGEDFLADICSRVGLNVVYNRNKISEDGTYDILIEDFKVEVKTAREGKKKNYQHENLRQDEDCDLYMFVDLNPESIFLTIIPKWDMSKNHPIFNKKAHLRRNSNNQRKFDFSTRSIRLGIEAGVTFKHDTLDESQLEDFIKSRIYSFAKVAGRV